MKKYVYSLVLFFSFQGALFLHADNNQWEKTEFIWNFSIISSCDKGLAVNPIQFFGVDRFHSYAYRDIKRGDVVWVQARYLSQFYRKIMPKVQNPFVLVISDGDDSFPTDCKLNDDVENFIADEKIIHIFAQNYDYHGPSLKVSPLPIGIDFHTIAYKGGEKGAWGERGSAKDQESKLSEILKELQPTYLRKVGAFVDFQHSDSTHANFKRCLQFGEDRATIFQRLLLTGLIDYSQGFMKRYSLWKTKGQYAFSISPYGNGLDCHRTWEDLTLGCIVIVKSCSLDPMYEGLPVITVKDWSEVTRENMEIWLKQYGDAFTNPAYREKLTNRYWLEKILEKARPYRT